MQSIPRKKIVESWKPYGTAMMDYYSGISDATVNLCINGHEEDDLPMEILFRDETQMNDLEQYALFLCKGHILDAGAGAGSHALALQERGESVTAIDISPQAVEVMLLRGVQNAHCADIRKWAQGSYDTILMMMNGIGLVGDLDGFKYLLDYLNCILNPGAQILFDSADLRLNPDLAEEIAFRQAGGRYFGEVDYRMEYKKLEGQSYSWLFMDQATVLSIADEFGYYGQIMMEQSDGSYLVRLTR